MSEPTALIVTLELQPEAARRYTALRQAHFPADRNHLAAHVTLFHALPVDSLDAVLTDAAEVAAAAAPFAMRADRMLFLGRGVAVGFTSPDGLQVRATLAERWAALLGRQDRAWPGRLHVTLQNKVDPAIARALHAEMAAAFRPEEIGATGLGVWYYVGGPWRPAGSFGFAGRGVAS